MKKLLLLGPIAQSGTIGGLSLALDDLVTELRRQGWQVDSTDIVAPAPTVVDAPRLIGVLQRSPWFLRARLALPAGLRYSLSALFWSAEVREGMAKNLRWAEEQLAKPGRYDIVLVCPDVNVPGILALALDRHPRVAVLSLFALPQELRPCFWSLLRRPKIHPFLFRPALANQIRCAIFASEAWRRKTIATGLSPAVAHTIYFGIPVGPIPPRPHSSGHRLLWIGRLTPEKGLHHLLEALPVLRRGFPDLQLTAVAGHGEAAYRRYIESLIESLELTSLVRLLPPVPREDLPALYNSHDAFFFYSVFEEPVALVLMEAYAHGIPVIANHVEGAELVEDAQTCLTCQPADPHSVADAFCRLFDDAAATAQIAAHARRLVETKYSLVAMGEAYDRLLTSMLNSRTSSAVE